MPELKIPSQDIDIKDKLEKDVKEGKKDVLPIMKKYGIEPREPNLIALANLPFILDEHGNVVSKVKGQYIPDYRIMLIDRGFYKPTPFYNPYTGELIYYRINDSPREIVGHEYIHVGSVDQFGTDFSKNFHEELAEKIASKAYA